MMDMSKDMTYPVMEHFYTIQGEGRYTGNAAYFVRLGGCDVGCVWCDVKESWDANKHPKYSVAEIISWVLDAKAKICVITGGEPAMYNLTPLADALRENGIRSHIETSGAHPILGNIDWVCLSPKKFKSPLDESLHKADEFKVVVYHKSDISWGLQFVPQLKEGCLLYLQPEWSKSEQMLPIIIDYVKNNPKWQISLQTHKFINIP